MAKKLIPLSGYQFLKDESQIRIDGNYQLEQILLITNITAGKPLYQFNSARFGSQSRIFNEETEQTVINLTYDASTDDDMAETDELQIFVDVENTTFSPSESLLDAVGKLRVSNPGNLIDTDFEYGLQSTKWETIQTVNNIPTVYSSAGDIPVEGILSVESIAGSKQVKVTVNTSHTLSIGEPLSVQGLQDYQAEGFFIVSGVPDSFSFFFELDVPASTTGDISGGYTTIIGAKFFEGSPLLVSTEDGATTDGGSPSTISVTTAETHGFAPGTKVYLRNTVGPKTLIVDEVGQTAPDGRPYIDTQTFFSSSDLFGTVEATGRGSFRENNVVAYDWESTYNKYLSDSIVDAGTNRITWVGHEMNNSYAILFNTPIKGGSDYGMNDGYVYYTKRIDADTIELYNDYNLSSQVSFSAQSGTKGASRIGLCYKVEKANGSERSTPFSGNFGGTISLTNTYLYSVSGSGTSASPYSGASNNRGSHGSNAYANFRVNSAGTVFWSMNVSSEGSFDFSRLYINGSNVYNRSGSGSQSGSSFAPTGANVQATYYKDGSVNSGADRGYINSLYMTGSGGATSTNDSGADFATYTYGLGKAQPTRAIAFQGRTPGSYNNSGDAYSYLANQRTNGRYGVVAGQYNNNITGTGSQGTFNINYNDNNQDYGAGSEIFYVFANDLVADRNTLYYEDHGILNGTEATIILSTSQYAAGERFVFADSSGNSFSAEREFNVHINVVSSDLIRIQRVETPATDDILDFPESGFTLEYRTENSLFNTIYVPNHKVTGSAEAVYEVEGAELPATVTYDVTNDGSADYVFNGADVSIDAKDPDLIVYRGQAYEFALNAAGHPFYITTDDGTGYVSGTYVGEYTDGVTGSRTQVGTVAWTVPAGAPNTLYYQCGNHGEMFGTIEVRDVGSSIGGIVSGGSYNLVRVNDSRVSLSQLVASSATALSAVIGASNNNTQTLDINVQAPLGLVPTDASIQKVEFRGDFSASSEYVALTFEDNETFLIGQRNGSDSSIWQEDSFFPVKNISSLLKDIGGGTVGFSVTVDPTSQVNFTPRGMSNWWEIRFTLSGDSGVVSLSSGGSGEQRFIVNSVVGSYDGVFSISEIDNPNSFKMTSDFEIPSRRYEFTSAEINATDDIIDFGEPHNLITGERLFYQSNGNDSIFVSTEVASFFAIALDADRIKIAESNLSALNNISLDLQAQGGTHTLLNLNVIKSTAGQGSVTTQVTSKEVIGNGTNFLTSFKRFDKIYITGPDYVKEHVVDTITTNERMTVFDDVGTAISDSPYFISSQMILRPDGYSLHKSFDGGVDITAGTSPNSKIVRQSRKYFRYQSGKGIQNSFAINFNPPRIVRDLIKSDGLNATVNTQEQHNLSVGDVIRIENAETIQGNNTYNGTFSVTSIGSPFQFSYTMLEEPDQQKAGGFPTYVRDTWNDSYVRAGMFDDQNGFFMEYDGGDLYMVRRSSTKQLAGDVAVTRGSQVVTGRDTSFTTQINRRDKIVIRGQSYLVVEVSSDSRIVVQPAYRGVTARGVKITKTEDARTPQHQWNLDICDGTGPSGFLLDINKLQMAYADYSWYGAGKIRYGFKDRDGHVVYVHEYKHNNRLAESYFRSGNLPGRYEIENGPSASTAPTLFHFGTSIIMDGRFDDDKAYLFTANSRPFAFTNGSSVTYTSTGISTFELVTLNGRRVWVYTIPVSESNAQATTVGSQIRDAGNVEIPEGTYVTQVKVSGGTSAIYTSYPATNTEPGPPTYSDIPSGTSITLGETAAVELTQPLPLVSIRLAPSVDSSLTGAIGEREIINRMQLALKQAGVTSNQDVEVFLIVNSLPSRFELDKADSPSLSEVIDHSAGDTLISGTTIYSIKSSAGSVEIDLKDLLELGNSILGGDGIFPAGPDLLTLAVQPQSTSSIDGANPFFVSGKISWSESQA